MSAVGTECVYIPEWSAIVDWCGNKGNCIIFHAGDERNKCKMYCFVLNFLDSQSFGARLCFIWE